MLAAAATPKTTTTSIPSTATITAAPAKPTPPAAASTPTTVPSIVTPQNRQSSLVRQTSGTSSPARAISKRISAINIPPTVGDSSNTVAASAPSTLSPLSAANASGATSLSPRRPTKDTLGVEPSLSTSGEHSLSPRLERTRSVTNTIVPEAKFLATATTENPTIVDVLEAIDNEEHRAAINESDVDVLEILYEEVNSFVWESRIQTLEGWLLKLVDETDRASAKKQHGIKTFFGATKLKAFMTPWQAHWFVIRNDKVHTFSLLSLSLSLSTNLINKCVWNGSCSIIEKSQRMMKSTATLSMRSRLERLHQYS